MNKIRSSRRIEMEATRNMEVMWLVGKVTPHAFMRQTV
ncbi:hypothetical protein CDO51_04950 [Natranaerobius trueperi]|uniref:Transposase InsH N-terminal domain-containing protein n=1 Tax=Natranaerobius trueperi TaxID=759412 RepID=A0A226C108_9FIRM|nr:hypothetical protein CDO51_04950 [Natranaerobius trueperi]